MIVAIFRGYPLRGDLNAFCDRHGLPYFTGEGDLKYKRATNGVWFWALTFKV